MFDLRGKRIFVAGHAGMVGAALVRRLEREDCAVVTAARDELDLREQAQVREWFADHQPDAVFLAAARVGGIRANDRLPADFLLDNLQIAANVIEAAHRQGTAKLLFLGSSCIYPRDADQPMAEDALLTGPLEPTNQWYAIAKIAGVKLCQAFRRQHGCDFIAAMPTNLYGPGDNYDLEASHVLPALLRKAITAARAGERNLDVWGSGEPLREFLHVDDLADAMVFLMRHYSSEDIVNIGSGEEVSIAELSRIVMDVAGLPGEPRFDPSQPDGTPRKLLDISRLDALGWQASISLRAGIEQTHAELMSTRRARGWA